MLGSISWYLKKQSILTLSTTEIEFVATTSCACQGIWLRNILHQFGQTQEHDTIITCNNISTIKLSKNTIMHERCKHTDVKFHILRDLIKDGIIEMCHWSSKDQFTDVLIKPLNLDSFCTVRTRFIGYELEDN